MPIHVCAAAPSGKRGAWAQRPPSLLKVLGVAPIATNHSPNQRRISEEALGYWEGRVT